MSKLLFDEMPLVVDRTLVAMVGLHEAIVVQQMHYWLELNKKAGKNKHDGFFWTYNSYREWHKQFPFWTERTIQRLILSLEQSGVLVSGNFNEAGLDRTKWYRVDYDKLSQWNTTNCRNDDDKSSLPIPENNSENNSENNKLKPSASRNPYVAEMQKHFGFPERADVADPIPNPSKEGNFIKKMMGRGFTWEQIFGLWKQKVNQRREFVSMQWVNEDIAKERNNGGVGVYRSDSQASDAARLKASVGRPIDG